jgi:transcriptional regulator with XRE-family HTH domain
MFIDGERALRHLAAVQQTNHDLPSARWLRAVRGALGWTQEHMANRSGLQRIEVLNVEKGRNKASSARIRVALARGLGVRLVDVCAGLDGHAEPDDVLRRMRRRRVEHAA